jgi:hypothetical protein
VPTLQNNRLDNKFLKIGLEKTSKEKQPNFTTDETEVLVV